MRKLIRSTLLISGLGYLAWQMWQEYHREATRNWAEHTDRIG